MEEKNFDKDINVRSKDDTEIDVGMTDGEIVKAFEHCKVKDGRCTDCILEEEDKLCVSNEDVLDLIHRLQGKITEYEQKLADGELVSKEWHDEQVLYLTDDNELKRAQVGLLTEQVKFLKDYCDKLIEERENMQAEIIATDEARLQTAKDTVKEILDELDLFFKGTTFRKGYEFKKIDKKLKEIAKRKGVEVE